MRITRRRKRGTDYFQCKIMMENYLVVFFLHKKNVWIQRGELPVLPSQYAIWLVLVRLTSAPRRPSLAAFDYLAVAVPLPSCHYFWQIIIKMTLSQCELLSHGQETRRTHTHPWRAQARRTHNTHNCILLMQNTHGHHTVLTAG